MLCDLDHAECECELHRKRRYISLSILLLDCWQREYDERPYVNFKISRRFFEERTRRPFNQDDWLILIDFLNLTDLDSVEITYIPVPKFEDANLTKHLVKGLWNVESIHLVGVSLPLSFLEEFHRNISSCKVKSLDLRENDLTADHLLVLRCILLESPTITKLNVACCFMVGNTFPILADGVHKSKSLKCLDVSRLCPISPVSIFENSKFGVIVAQLVWQNKLTELHLRQCNLSGHDMEPISEYLAMPTSNLLFLNLNGNNIASVGTEILFKALVVSRTMRKLNLGSNNLGQKGGKVIARMLAFTNLRSLDITHNNITKALMYELLVALKKPCELKKLKMFGNEFDPKTAEVLKRLLKARVLEQDNLDCTYTWDHCKDELSNFGTFSDVDEDVGVDVRVWCATLSRAMMFDKFNNK